MSAVLSLLRSLPGGVARLRLNDQELLRRFIASRDEEAFATLMGRYAPLVWSVCRRQLSVVADAEDAFQATFLILARKASTLQKQDLLANWLHGVARRIAWNLRRKQLRRARHEQPGLMNTVPADVSPIPDHDLLQRIDEEIARLPIRYRLPLLLCSFQGMTQREAALALDWPKGTIAVNLSRGKEILQKRLALRGYPVAAVTSALALVLDQAHAQVPAVLMLSTLRLSKEVASQVLAQVALSSSVRMLVTDSAQGWTGLALLPWIAGALGAMILGVAGFLTLSPKDAAGVTLPTPLKAHVIVPRPEIRLPTDPATEIVRWKQEHWKDGTELLNITIHADGRWVALRLAARAQSEFKHEGRFSANELQDLMHFLVTEMELLDFQAPPLLAELKARYRYDGPLDKNGDQVRTTVSLLTADRRNQFIWDQLDSSAVYFGHYLRIQQLTEAKRRMYHLIARVEAGGLERVQQLVSKTNQLLLQTYPKMPLFEVTDLLQVESNPPDGRPGIKRISLVQGDKFGSDHYFSARCDVDPQGNVQLNSVVPGASRQPPVLPLRSP